MCRLQYTRHLCSIVPEKKRAKATGFSSQPLEVNPFRGLKMKKSCGNVSFVQLTQFDFHPLIFSLKRCSSCFPDELTYLAETLCKIFLEPKCIITSHHIHPEIMAAPTALNYSAFWWHEQWCNERIDFSGGHGRYNFAGASQNAYKRLGKLCHHEGNE